MKGHLLFKEEIHFIHIFMQILYVEIKLYFGNGGFMEEANGLNMQHHHLVSSVRRVTISS